MLPELTVPPLTSSPGPFFTGLDSPVKLLSSTVDVPSAITPSHGILSPLFTATIAPTGTDVAGTTISSLVFGWMILARSGLRLTIDVRAAFALLVARSSNHSDIEKRNVTAAPSSNCFKHTAPTTARNIRTFVSIMPRRAVRNALFAIGGIPNTIDTSPRYERYALLCSVDIKINK